jgi:hypothetical protein
LATDNPRPWAGLGTHYALLEERALRVVQASADATVDALLRELLADAASVS